MADNFRETTIGEVCSVGDGAHAKVTRQETGILYLTSKNIALGHLKLNTVDYISEEDFEKLFPKNSRAVSQLTPGDVLIGIIGTFGNAYRYKESDHFGISSSVAILRPDQSILDSDFLYYVVTSKTFKDIHAAYKSGSVQGYTNIPTIKFLPITLPPLDEQNAIAHILGTLDDKIELNQQMNQTLESIARALFKSWFIDFDPVRAKLEGQQPAGMDAETAALFLDEFEDSVLGEIPKGWRVETLGSVVEINSRSVTKDYPHQVIQYIDISSVTVGRLEGTTIYELSNAPSRAKRLVHHGDTIWSGVRPNRKS
jgi:type I restriction enzyme, S subunit